MTERRDRSAVIIIRHGRILMEKVHFFGRDFYTLPGGGIENGETPEEAAVRELKEECGLDGTIRRPLAILFRKDGIREFSFEVTVPEDQEALLGYDPEFGSGKEEQPLKEVMWLSLDEVSEKDRAFLWSYGLMDVEDYTDVVIGWGEEISYPGKNGDEKAAQ